MNKIQCWVTAWFWITVSLNLLISCCRVSFLLHLLLLWYKVTLLSKNQNNLTWEILVYSLNSSKKAASLLNPVGCCYSDPALPDERTGRWEMMTQLHSLFLRGYTHPAWRDNIGKKTTIYCNENYYLALCLFLIMFKWLVRLCLLFPGIRCFQ